MTDDTVTLLWPMHTYRALHSAYVDAVLDTQDRPEVHRWLLGLTEGQLTSVRFLLGILRRGVMRESYIVAEDESRAWLRLSAQHPGGEWIPILTIDLDDLGLPVSYLAAVEADLIDRELGDLIGGDA